MSVASQSLKSTAIGCIAIVLWSMYALIDQQLHAIPITQMVMITFCISTMVWLLYLRTNLLQVIVTTPKPLLLSSIFGIGISPICYLGAFRYIPPEQVDLITYLWPVIFVLCMNFLPNEQKKLPMLLAVLLAGIGLYVVRAPTANEPQMDSMWLGYGLAVMAAVTWALYTLAMRYYHRTKTDPRLIALSALNGAIMMGLIWFFGQESWVSPSHSEWFWLSFIGIGMCCLAYWTWAIGIQQGNTYLLSVLSYLIPVFSILILLGFGFLSASWSLLFGTLLIMGAVSIAAYSS